MKKLKKQQEQALAEIIQKKEELNKYCEEERLKTIQWCEEQKQSIEKEKRTAAKQVRSILYLKSEIMLIRLLDKRYENESR